MGATIIAPALAAATSPDIEGLPFVYLAYGYIDATDLAAIIHCFDNIHRDCLVLFGVAESRQLRIQGVETKSSIVMAFLAFAKHYGPIAFHALKDVAPIASTIYQIKKIRQESREKKETVKAEEPGLPSDNAVPSWEQLTEEQRSVIRKHAAELTDYISRKENIRLLVAGDGESLAVPSRLPGKAEEQMYAWFEMFDTWRARQRQLGTFRKDSDAVSAWLEVEGYEYISNHYAIYLMFNSFLSNKGLEITYVLSYQSFMAGYRLQAAKGKRI